MEGLQGARVEVTHDPLRILKQPGPFQLIIVGEVEVTHDPLRILKLLAAFDLVCVLRS